MSGITLLGDVNIDMLQKLHEDTISLNDILWDHGQLVQQEYHLIHCSSTCIDIIASNMSFVMEAGVIIVPISAHYLTYLVRKKFRNKIDKTETLGRSYRNYSYEQLAWLIKHNNDWKLFWEYDRSVDQMWE